MDNRQVPACRETIRILRLGFSVRHAEAFNTILIRNIFTVIIRYQEHIFADHRRLGTGHTQSRALYMILELGNFTGSYGLLALDVASRGRIRL